MLFEGADVSLENIGRWLLGNCLAEMTGHSLRKFKVGNEWLLAFRKPRDSDIRTEKYLGLQNNTERDVISIHERGNGEHLYRHFAFHSRFDRIRGQWTLEIQPTYVFTTDGHNVSAAAGNWTSGKKAMEHNESVRNNVVFWWRYLTRQPSVFERPYRFLAFGELLQASAPRGLTEAYVEAMVARTARNYSGLARPRGSGVGQHGNSPPWNLRE